MFCAGCSLVISRSSYSVFALNDVWHVECFRCSVCFKPLKENYYSKENELFCQEDFILRFSQVCQKCNTSITGPVMVAGDVSFHPECFMCNMCKKFIGDGDEYTLEERNCLFCGTCFSSHRSKNVNGAQNIVGREQHTIRHVQLNPDQIGDKGIPLNIDKVKHTGPKLREEVLRRIGNSVERADNNDKSSFISIKGG